ncbi:TolC family outer membrane protein [Pokkaliibacter sp. CJK22405]|uniref:TolC family outer membrane protein n=1 Tax=Pokkaliibacter sp. CJK22405 TaxID=3384615 RepID=UPI0039847F13
MNHSNKAFRLSLLTLSILGFGQANADTLEQVIKDNVYKSPLVEQAKYDHQTDKQAIREARSGYLPTIDLNLAAGREKTEKLNGNTVNDIMTRREASLTLSQTLFDGFQTSSEVARQTAAADASALQLDGQTDSVALQIASAYLNVYRRNQLLLLAQENLSKHQSIYDQIQQRRQSGVASQAELAQAETRLALAQANVISARNNLSDEKATYMQVVGVEPNDTVFPDFNEALLPQSEDAAVALALDSNKILQSANSDIEEAQAQVKSRNGSFFPRVTFEVSRNWDENVDGVRGEDADYMAMVRMNYNLFNGGADSSRHKQAIQQVSKAKSVRDQTYREVIQTTQLSWSAYDLLKQQIPYYEGQVRSAEQTRELYKQQFNLGQRSLLDLLDSENELFEARNSLVGAQADFRYAEYRLLAASSQLMVGIETPDKVMTGSDTVADTAAMPVAETPVEPQTAAPADADYDAVKSELNAWQTAWEGKDINAYIAQYTDDFAPANQTHAQWVKERTSRLAYPKWIKVEIGDPQISVMGDRAVVRFSQHYTANHYEDNVMKELMMVRQGDQWKIAEEMSL